MAWDESTLGLRPNNRREKRYKTGHRDVFRLSPPRDYPLGLHLVPENSGCYSFFDDYAYLTTTSTDGQNTAYLTTPGLSRGPPITNAENEGQTSQ